MCFLKDKNKGGNNNKASKWTKKEEQYINQVIKRKMGNGNVVSNLTEGSKPKKKPKWAKRLSNSDQMYVMSIARQEDVDVDDIDSNDLNDYKKQAKYASKQLKWFCLLLR